MAGPAALALAATLLAAPGPAAGADPGRGRALFEERCVMCHAAEALRGKGSLLVHDLRHLAPAMFPVGILSDEEVAALAAYLNGLADAQSRP